MSLQSFDNFNLLLQLMQATRNLAKDMRDNAQDHIAWAQAQSVDLPTLQGFVNDCATSYLSRGSIATAWVQGNAAQTLAALQLIGASMADLSNYTTPLKTAIQNLQAADKSSYGAIITACNALLSAVGTPASIFGA